MVLTRDIYKFPPLKSVNAAEPLGLGFQCVGFGLTEAGASWFVKPMIDNSACFDRAALTFGRFPKIGNPPTLPQIVGS